MDYTTKGICLKLKHKEIGWLLGTVCSGFLLCFSDSPCPVSSLALSSGWQPSDCKMALVPTEVMCNLTHCFSELLS